MKKIAALTGVALLGSLAATGAQAYNKLATLTFTFGGNTVGSLSPNVTPNTISDGGGGLATLPYSATSDIGWTSSGTNTLSALTNTTFFSTLNGYNSISYTNSDYVSAAQCATIVAGLSAADPANAPYVQGATRKYECRYSLADATPTAIPAPVSGAGPVAQASGTLTVTDTTMTGTLTIVNTSDVPTGATTSFVNSVTPPLRTSTSVGNGFAGYNYRSADGSPFGNSWYGVSTAGTYTVNLTGTFNDTTWTIDGGSATFSDPGFACAQGGLGGGAAGTLCTFSTTGGGFQGNGANLSWGYDPDGIGTAFTSAVPIVVKDAGGTTTLTILSGILANLTVDGGGVVATTQAEFRRALGSAAGNCPADIRYDGTKISCGSITTGLVTITGTAADPDTTPDAFTFTPVTNAGTSTVQTSDTVTIGGINTAAPVTVTGGTYSIGCTATFVSTPGTINNGQTVCVQQTSSASQGVQTDTVLTIGGVAGTYSVTTSVSDTTPNPFSFTAQGNVALDTLLTSDTVTISGLDPLPVTSPISIVGGSYSIGCTGTFVFTAGTISNGQTVCVQQVSSTSFSTATNAVLTIGGVNGTFTVTTLAIDTTPNAFTFAAQNNVALATDVTSNTVTITGINSPAAVTITGGTYSVGCNGTFVSTAGAVNNNDTVCVRQTSSAVPATPTNAVLTVGGVAGTFTVTTVPEDTTPNAFSFTAQNNVALLTPITSNTVTISGINKATPVSITGGTYSLDCNGTFVATAGTITNGQTVCVRQTSSDTAGVKTTATLTIGGVAANFNVTTAGGSTGLPGGNSAMDEFAIAVLGLVAFLRRGRRNQR